MTMLRSCSTLARCAPRSNVASCSSCVHQHLTAAGLLAAAGMCELLFSGVKLQQPVLGDMEQYASLRHMLPLPGQMV